MHIKTTFNQFLAQMKNKSIAILGVGISNTPLAALLARAGARVTAFDGKSFDKLPAAARALADSGVAFICGGDYLDRLGQGEYDFVFRSPGIRPDIPALQAAVRKGAALTSEMEAFFSVCPAKIIAVTGSAGKTTTTTLMHEILTRAGHKCYIGGNIGMPLMDKAPDMLPSDIAVVELSSFQLMTMSDSPDIAVVTNITPNHLDMHTSVEEYTLAKRRLLDRQGPGGLAVLNMDDAGSAAFAPHVKGELRLFSRVGRPECGVYAEDGAVYSNISGNKEKIMDAADIFLPGTHNLENYMAAVAAVYGLVSADDIQTIAKTFTGIPHRIEFVRELNGVKYYNDSKATSPVEAIAGLRAFDQKVIHIAGGSDKNIPFDELGGVIVRHAKLLILTGKTSEKIHAAVIAADRCTAGLLPIIRCGSLPEAVAEAYRNAMPGDIVLFSPACASFDSFTNFEQRGDMFKGLVNGLK